MPRAGRRSRCARRRGRSGSRRPGRSRCRSARGRSRRRPGAGRPARRRPPRRCRARAAHGRAAGRERHRRRGARRRVRRRPPAAAGRTAVLPRGRADRPWRQSRGCAEAADGGGRRSTIRRVSPAPRGTRWLPWLALGAVVLVLGVVAVLLVLRGQGDVSNPDVTFLDTTERAPATDPGRGHDRHPADDGFTWPVYGYRASRTQHLPLRRTPRPPYRQAWAVRGKVLLEFAPVLCRRKLYLLKNNGALYAISRLTGRVSWKRRLGTLAAASPACGHGTVFALLLARHHRSGTGRVVAVSAKTGHVRWSRTLPSRAEGSPLLDRGRLFFGSEDGTVYALRASTGELRWRMHAAGAVKGAIALDRGKLYFGDYGGRVHAIRRSDGKKVWEVSPSSGPLGLGGGNFYSSAVVQYGRVYIGSTNGDIYSFSSAD